MTLLDAQLAAQAAAATEAAEKELLAKSAELEANIKWRDIEIARLRRLLYGRKSERLTREELGQLLLCYGASEEEAAADNPTLPVPTLEDSEPEAEGADGEAAPPKKRRPNHRGRGKLSPHLERVVHTVAVPEAERACGACGEEMSVFGHLDHERVEHVPAKLVVHVTRREKLGCKHCQGDATTAAHDRSAQPSLRVGASLLAYLIESKCDDALPIHRQCDQFARLGFELPTSTAYDYWRYATELLKPVSDALLGTVLEDKVWVAADDTGIDVLDRTRENNKYRGHLWCFLASSGLLAYQFTESWEAEEVAPWFHAIGEHTHVQVDDYKGYGSRFERDGIQTTVVPPHRRLGCMMHCRRRFYAAHKANDKRAGPAMRWIRQLYKIEEEAKELSPDERLVLRTEQSVPILDKFDAWVDEQEQKLGKTGKLAGAVRYAKQQRAYLRRCFTDGRFEIDNGAVERAIREPAIGRKNFLFTGSAEAGQRLAAAYSLVQTCRALNISTRDYLIDVLEKLEAGWPAKRLTELLPQNWQPARADG